MINHTRALLLPTKGLPNEKPFLQKAIGITSLAKMLLQNLRLFKGALVYRKKSHDQAGNARLQQKPNLKINTVFL